MGALNPPIDVVKYGERVIAEIRRELDAFSFSILGAIMRNAPTGVDGKLKGSMHVEPVPVPFGIAIDIGTRQEYGPYVEFGTRPHFPPIEPLLRWVEGKIQPHILAIEVSFPGKGKHAIPGKASKQLKGDPRQRAIMRVARAIQISISKKGTRPQLFIDRALDSFGLRSEVVHDADGSRYIVDLGAWLNARLPSIMDKVKLI